MSLIHVSDLTFSYEGSYDLIFDHVSFQIDTDWKLGFTGRNGRGKTTFLNLLMGKYEYSGTIRSSVPFSYFPCEVPDPEMETLLLLEQLCPDRMEWELLRELSLLEVTEDALCRPFSTLSKGEQTKALLGAMFLSDNRFLLIDEPTNHLDEHARQVVGNYLRRQRGFLLVSHDRSLLDRCTDHILSINRQTIEIQKGNFSSWWENKQRQDQFELGEQERLQKDVRRLSQAAQRGAGWSHSVERSKYGSTNSGSSIDRGYVGHKSAKLMKRAKAIESRQQKALAQQSSLLKNLERSEPLRLSPLPCHTDRLLELDSVSIAYGDSPVCGPISLAIRRRDRIALCGANGTGKSSLLKLICGQPIPHTGRVVRGSGLIISYISQETAHLQGNLSQYAAHHQLDESLFKAILRKLDFQRVQFEKDMAHFSGGQKKKVLLAHSLCTQAHLYVWDEPLNFIDVLSRTQIEALLLEAKATLIFVEHDRTFCEKIATERIWL